MYVGDLRRRLEMRHPRLCTLLHLTISVLLYADDAALPADSAEDLGVSMAIFEEFCNDMHLYIATGKTWLTVFCNTSDTGVVYSNGNVYVDGVKIDIRVYGDPIKAVDEFKYLGVMLCARGGSRGHIGCRLDAFRRATGMLIAGLARIPSYPYSLLLYLWQTLAIPVALYGFEVFSWTSRDLEPIAAHQRCTLRRLLQVGGRAPNDV
eukprot:10735822-Karenia_brevis.AAC.1